MPSTATRKQTSRTRKAEPHPTTSGGQLQIAHQRHGHQERHAERVIVGDEAAGRSLQTIDAAREHCEHRALQREEAERQDDHPDQRIQPLPGRDQPERDEAVEQQDLDRAIPLPLGMVRIGGEQGRERDPRGKRSQQQDQRMPWEGLGLAENSQAAIVTSPTTMANEKS